MVGGLVCQPVCRYLWKNCCNRAGPCLNAPFRVVSRGWLAVFARRLACGTSRKGGPCAADGLGNAALLEEDQLPIAGNPQAVGFFAMADHDFHLVTKNVPRVNYPWFFFGVDRRVLWPRFFSLVHVLLRSLLRPPVGR